MKCKALSCSVFAAAILTVPAFAGDGASEMMGIRWGKNAFNFEGMPSGPQPLRNLSRLPDGKANAGPLVGDYRNPIPTPEGVSPRPRPVPADCAAVHLRDAARLHDAADDGRRYHHRQRSERKCAP